MEMVVSLESATCWLPTAAGRVAAGNCCFLLHARARGQGAARCCDEPVLDEVAGEGFIETKVAGRNTKTGKAKKSWRLMLPLVADSQGLSQQSWGSHLAQRES